MDEAFQAIIRASLEDPENQGIRISAVAAALRTDDQASAIGILIIEHLFAPLLVLERRLKDRGLQFLPAGRDYQTHAETWLELPEPGPRWLRRSFEDSSRTKGPRRVVKQETAAKDARVSLCLLEHFQKYVIQKDSDARAIFHPCRTCVCLLAAMDIETFKKENSSGRRNREPSPHIHK